MMHGPGPSVMANNDVDAPGGVHPITQHRRLVPANVKVGCGELPAGLIRAARAIVVGAKAVTRPKPRAADQVLHLHLPGHGRYARLRYTAKSPRLRLVT